MEIFSFLPKKKIRVLTGMRVIAVRGKEEVTLYQTNIINSSIEVRSELVCEPIIEEKEVFLWE